MKNATRQLNGVTQIRKISAEDPNIQKKRQKKTLQDTATHNLNLLQYKRSILLKKIEKLQARLHLIGQEKKNNHTYFVDEEEDLEEFTPKKKVKENPKEEKEEKTKLYKKLEKHIENEKIIHQAIQDLEMNAVILVRN